MNIRLIFKRSAQLLLPMLMLLVSCNEQDPDSIVAYSVTDAETGEAIDVLTVDSEGGFYTVAPSTDSWSVVSDSEWCLPQKDQCLFYETNKNLTLYIYGVDSSEYGMSDDDGDYRVAFVTFTYGSADYKFMVVQNRSDNYITLIPGSKEVAYTASSFYIGVDASAEWEAYAPASWVTVEKVDGSSTTLKVSVAENPSEEERTATITVLFSSTEGNAVDSTSKTFELTQAGRSTSYVAADITEHTFVAESAVAKVVTVESNLYNPSYTVTSNSPEWCTVTTIDENLEFTISATTDNPSVASRDAVLTITATSEDGTITVDTTVNVYQAGLAEPTIYMGVTSYTYGSAATATLESISYIAVGDITAGTSESWITDVDADNAGVEFKLTENTTGEDRVGTITITASQGGKSVDQVITITQTGDALYLTVSSNYIPVEYNSDVINVVAESNGTTVTYTVSDTSWCVATTNVGEYTIYENTTGYERECTITVVAKMSGQEDKVETVTVYQAATSF